MNKSILFTANAHEGCVWVAAQQRLYFTTAPDLETQTVALQYLDFAGYELRDAQQWKSLLTVDPAQIPVNTFLANVNMANSFCLSADGGHFLVCEQGKEHRLSVISKIDLFTKRREVITDNFMDQAFNSLNKVIVSRQGHLVFTDPDYGFRQGFRPPPELEPGLYVRPANEQENYQIDEDFFKMPHGLALSADERFLFVTDTSNDGQHDEDIELEGRRDVYRLDFGADNGLVKGQPKLCFKVDAGVPDGMLFVNDHLLVCGGDGIYVANREGELLRKIELDYGPVNLDAVGHKKEHLFITVDEGVLFLADW